MDFSISAPSLTPIEKSCFCVAYASHLGAKEEGG